MNRLQGLVLVVIGAVLILVPVVFHEVGVQLDKDRLSGFYRQNPPGSLLPADLRPGGYEGYHWACFGVGAAIACTGLGRSKAGEAAPAKWPTTPEV